MAGRSKQKARRLWASRRLSGLFIARRLFLIDDALVRARAHEWGGSKPRTCAVSPCRYPDSMQFLHRSWLVSAFCAMLVTLATGLQAAALPAQKVATHYTSSAAAVPPDVLKEANGQAWANRERGPVPGLKILA